MLPRGEALSLTAALEHLPPGPGGSPVFRLCRLYNRPWPDGLRVLVDGLWPRGVRREEIDVWAREVAPSPALRQSYGHEADRQEVFRAAYAAELQARPEALAALRRLAAHEPVVLLYAARDDVLNNGRVLWQVLTTGTD